MREIDLPVLPSDTPLRSAMATMHNAGRSAVVTLVGGELKLIAAKDIVIAANAGKKTLSRIRDAKVVVTELSPLTRSRVWTVTKAEQPPLSNDFLSLFNSSNHDFALVRLAPGRASVMSRTETLGNPLAAAPKDCYCTQDETHQLNGRHPPGCEQCSGPVNCI